MPFFCFHCILSDCPMPHLGHLGAVSLRTRVFDWNGFAHSVFFASHFIFLITVEGTPFVSSALPNIRSCLPADAPQVENWAHVYVMYLCISAAEINVLILMLWRGYFEYKSYKHLGNRISLLQILYRDGIIYVFSMLALSASNLLFYTVHAGSLYWMLITEAQRIGHAIMAS
ncbi:hypothetical protein SCHPADRAFT_349506 [Schizopora paradoxa]|uniref:Uncharacterized protein n=1 Tax=Schizopora paradoxa TaxID=27342 RepID=A0A0H2RP04_9AGAM|nr:hypothetical protein SCHPADRAFT_349506 [Schizopora paradoxa]